MNLWHQYYRPMVPWPRPMLTGYPKLHPHLPPRKATVTPTAIGPMPMVYYHRLKLPIFSPIFGQMATIHKPSLYLFKLCSHFAPYFCPLLRFDAFRFSEFPMRGSSL